MARDTRALASYTHVGCTGNVMLQGNAAATTVYDTVVVLMWRHFEVVDADPRISMCAPVGAHWRCGDSGSGIDGGGSASGIDGGTSPCFLCTSHAMPVTMRCHRDGRGIRNSAGARPHSVDQLATLNLGLKESHERA